MMRALALSLCLFGSLPLTYAGDIHVATHGDDGSVGSELHPLRTMEGARNAVQRLRIEDPDSAIHVVVHEGTYSITSQWSLSGQDSGTESAPVVYTAAEGEKVVISGTVPCTRLGLAIQLDDYAQLPEVAKKHVLVYSVDIDKNSDLFNIPTRSLDTPMQPAPAELLATGRMLRRAAYPNSQWASFERDSASTFAERFNGRAWFHAFTDLNDEDSYRPLDQVKLQNVRQGARFRIENVLSELDSPGEWYLDSENSRVLWWPIHNDDVCPALTSLETLVSLYDVEHVSIEGFTFEGARVQAIEIAGGYNCSIRNCKVRCVGNVGINVFHGQHHSIEECEIHSIGSSGIRIQGGDLESMELAEHVCIKNVIHDTGKSFRAQRAAIDVHGVGISVRENTLHDLPDWAICIHGDSHFVEFNEIYNVCQETSDTGAIYLAQHESFRNNRIAFNHIHHVGSFEQRNVFAIYLDGRTSNTQVVGNWIHDAPRAIVARAGSRNEMRNNVIFDCLVGIQVEPADDSQENRVVSNVIASENAIVISENQRSTKIAQNTRRIDELFVDHRAGDLAFKNIDLAQSFGISELPFGNQAASPLTGSVLVSK
ncbi:MAG: right-handed parallel beta-helix repeat-containing protein [Pirellula sp.]